MPLVNIANFKKEITRQAGGFLNDKAYKIFAIPAFEEKKSVLLNDFDNHIITQEIKQGPDGNNISNTLIGLDDHEREGDVPPNLFSFIGFDRNSNPIENLRDRIDDTTSISKKPDTRYFTSQKNKIEIKFRVKIPTKETIMRGSPMPDYEKGGSWAINIEKGLSGIGYYLAKIYEKGRSGTGVQAKNRKGQPLVVNKNAHYIPPPEGYLTYIFNRFRSLFS